MGNWWRVLYNSWLTHGNACIIPSHEKLKQFVIILCISHGTECTCIYQYIAHSHCEYICGELKNYHATNSNSTFLSKYSRQYVQTRLVGRYITYSVCVCIQVHQQCKLNPLVHDATFVHTQLWLQLLSALSLSVLHSSCYINIDNILQGWHQLEEQDFNGLHYVVRDVLTHKG